MTGSPPRRSTLTPAQRIDRMRARSWVLHILYAWESQDGAQPLDQVMESVLATRRVAPEREPHIRRHVEVLSRHLDEIDGRLRNAVENWRLERLSRVDRSVLRLAAAEILHLPETPAKVAIQEGVRIAGQYGGNDSARFVNGVLDAVFRAREAES